MAGEIHVYFHNSGGDDRSGINATSPKNKGVEEKVKDATRTSAGKNQEESDNSLLTSILIDSVKKIAIDSINNIGDLSGNYQNQRNIQNAINGVGTAIQLLNYPVGTIATSLSLVSNVASHFIQRQNDIQQIELLKQRSGNAVFDDKGTNE